MYAYSNDGLSSQWHAAGYVAQAGEVLFDHLASDGELDSAFPGHAAAKAAADQEKAALAAYAAAVAAGIEVHSTGTPALNGVYAIDAGRQQIISGISAGIAARNRVPGGGATFSYPEANGTPHDFTGANFLNFAAAIEDYLYALSNGKSPATPLVIT